MRPYPKPEPKQKKKPGRIKPRSSKRAAQEREYSAVRKEFLEQNPLCAVCGKPANQVHHQAGREGGLLTDTKYFLPVDQECHEKIEKNPTWAYLNNYSIKRTNHG